MGLLPGYEVLFSVSDRVFLPAGTAQFNVFLETKLELECALEGGPSQRSAFSTREYVP